MKARWQDPHHVASRLVITGVLELLTPAHFGNGEADALSDMPLLRDPLSGQPMLTGTSIAGALRSYLREWEAGFGKPEPKAKLELLAQQLFGDVVDQVSYHSRLVVEDALAEGDPSVEFRAGVAIDPVTRTASAGKLFESELIEAGARFPLRFELGLPADGGESLRRALAVALTGLERGEIGLGMRKRRGLGECVVRNWRVERYDLLTGADLVAWLEGQPGVPATGATIAEQLGLTGPLAAAVPDQRRRLVLEAAFRLESSLLIRSSSGGPKSPDMVHLKSRRAGREEPVLSGTSLAGALRARALRIAQTVHGPAGAALVEGLFGQPLDDEAQPRRPSRAKEKSASRAVVHESVVAGGVERVQSRVKLDRFTGGSYPGALFDQQPVFGAERTVVPVRLEVRQPSDPEIGLLLGVLKDLWTGDLPLGGEASVGRGRLAGLSARLSLAPQTWRFSAGPHGGLQVEEGDLSQLEDFVQAFAQYGGQS